jgi:hypothetical protein
MSTLCFENAILRECKGQLVAIVSDMVDDGLSERHNFRPSPIISSLPYGLIPVTSSLLTCTPYVKPNQSDKEDTVTAYTLVN